MIRIKDLPDKAAIVNTMSLQLSFFGAAGTVTGSKYLLEHDGHRVLVDSGLFQGYKVLRLKNWARLPIEPRSIAAVVLTHAHLDHSGYLPLLVKHGFRGPVFCTEATRQLCEILLPDSGHIQENDAEFANRHRFSKHDPALPLYTQEDAERALHYLKSVNFDQPLKLPGGGKALWRRAGHILGAASVEIEWASVRTVFSGDIGRYDDPMMVDPSPVARADYLVTESTYGDRRHDRTTAEDALADVINRTVHRGGTVVIPAFAVGRAQSVLFYLQNLKAASRVPAALPVFLDSPMAIDASDIFCANQEDHRLSQAQCRAFQKGVRYVRDANESRELTASPMPKVIISASGMATGGRVLHHLKQYGPDPRSAIVFTGFQAGGTRGAAMVAGAESVKIHGAYVSIRAEVKNLDMLSAHADSDEILRWLRGFKHPPRRTFMTHGEPAACDALRHRVEEELGWDCLVPEHGQTVTLA
jgi:metallo-beta-lactamase family protein